MNKVTLLNYGENDEHLQIPAQRIARVLGNKANGDGRLYLDDSHPEQSGWVLKLNNESIRVSTRQAMRLASEEWFPYILGVTQAVAENLDERDHRDAAQKLANEYEDAEAYASHARRALHARSFLGQ